MIENFSINIDLFYFLNSFAGQNILLDYFFVFLGEYLIFFIIFFYVIFFAKKIWADKKIELKEFFIYFSGAISAWFLTKVIKTFVPTERPFLALENVTRLYNTKLEDTVKFINDSSVASFPSGHTTLSFALAFSIFLYDKKVGTVFLVLAFLVGLGRVFVGDHFPLDVFVGAILGVLVSGLLWKFFNKK
jgi:undecaprenyl-diphosphatase